MKEHFPKLFKIKDPMKNKFKKNALEPVNLEFEYKLDPKFKTELCKSFEENKFCVYGNKCRFAHGRNELFDKSNNKYKKKECYSFFNFGYCSYGNRCHFKHNEKKLDDIDFSYFNSLLMVISNCSNNMDLKLKSIKIRRLQVFSEIHKKNRIDNEINLITDFYKENKKNEVISISN
jgi:hypothetical protein